MNVTFNPYLSDSMLFRPEQMYGENREIFEELPFIVKGNIYFLAERRKVRVLPNSISLSDDGYISASFVLEDGSEKSARFPFAPTIFELGKIFLKVYENADILQQHVVKVENQAEYFLRQKSKSDRPLIGVSLDAAAQNKKNIAVCLYTPDGQVVKLPFSTHSILNAFDIEIGDHPLIVYVGKSENLKDRIYRHEKIQQALSALDDERDLYLYAFQFDANKYMTSYLPDKTLVIRRDLVNDITAQDQLSIVEMCLINYFKPRFNKHYKDCEIPLNPVYQAALKRHYNQVVLEVKHNAGFWNFGTEHIAAKLKHDITYPVHV